MQKAKSFSGTYELKWVERVSRLMDSKFTIPGTRFKFGLDPILGLLPFVGEASTFAISGTLVLYMVKHGASGKVVVLMILNILLDTIIGGIPVIGNIFDFFYKANNRNVRLLKKHYEEGKYQGSGKGTLIVVALIIFVLFLLIAYLFWKLTFYLINMIGF